MPSAVQNLSLVVGLIFLLGSFCCSLAEMTPASIHEDAGSIPGPA